MIFYKVLWPLWNDCDWHWVGVGSIALWVIFGRILTQFPAHPRNSPQKKRKQSHSAIQHKIIPVSLVFLKLVSIFLCYFRSYLHNNRWDCKCSDRGLLTLLKKHNNIKLGSAPAICHTPYPLKGKRIDQECGKLQIILSVNFKFSCLTEWI